MTVSSERSGDLTLGGGSSKAEVNGKATRTRSFEKGQLLPERKCIDLLNILLPKWKIPYYTTADDWRSHRHEYLRRLLIALHSADVTVASAQAREYAGRQDAEGRALERQAQRSLDSLNRPPFEWEESNKKLWTDTLNRNLQVELSKASGLIVFEGDFRKPAQSSGGRVFEATFGNIPRRITFRFSLLGLQKAEPIIDGLNLRIFGSIIHQLGDGNYIEILPSRFSDGRTAQAVPGADRQNDWTKCSPETTIGIVLVGPGYKPSVRSKCA